MTKVVYMHPGESLEVRFCPRGTPKRADSWIAARDRHGNEPSLLMRVWDDRIAYSDPAVQTDNRFLEPPVHPDD